MSNKFPGSTNYAPGVSAPGFKPGKGNKGKVDRAARRAQKQEDKERARYTADGGGIKYDSRDVGVKAFTKTDYNHLKEQGYNEKQIRKHAENRRRNTISANAQVKLGMDDHIDYGNLDTYNPHELGNRNSYDAEGNFSQERHDKLVSKGRGKDLQQIEVRKLMKDGGHSAQEINDWAKKNKYTFGDGAQEFLNKRLGRMTDVTPSEITAAPDTPKEDITTTLPGAGDVIASGNMTDVGNIKDSGNINDSFNQTADFDATQTVGSDKFKDNVYSTSIGGDNFGNVNMGNEMGVYITGQNQSQSRGGSDEGVRGSMGFTDLGLDNFASGAATMGLLENALARSQANFSSVGRAAQASKAGERLTGNTKRISGLDFRTRMNPHILQGKSDSYAGLAFGDIYRDEFADRHKGGYEFARPEDPELPDFDLDKESEKAREGL